MKQVAIIIRQPPLGSTKASEALRVAVGQTLRDNAVMVAFIDDGAWATLPLRPEVVKGPELKKHIEALRTLGHHLVVDEESLKARGIDGIEDGIEVKPRRELFTLISKADAVLVF